ncbi:MAG: aldehyde dehydrogenase family protein [Verrucomicrobiales bacterium]|nr:aldehyde dehydrogenase family protein [Verrucomicrobiales bacterium]
MRRRLQVLKTYKLFIGGKFPRSESGRFAAATAHGGEHLANFSLASRKDLREAVVAARKSAGAWAATSAYLKGQILYRLAEMLESRAAALADEISRATGVTQEAACEEVGAATDRLVYYAGWTDKLQQVLGAVNPVASSHFNFTTLEPTGVVALVAPDQPCLLGPVTMMAAALAGGNAVVLLASETFPLPLVSVAEVIATSDVPAGVVNILTGRRRELAKTLAEHMDINAIADGSGDAALHAELQGGAAFNLKRVRAWGTANWAEDAACATPWQVAGLMEAKTVWHPVGF